MQNNGQWVSIIEYAQLEKISISTIRRAIKSGTVIYKEEKGKYFVLTSKNIDPKNKEVELTRLKIENEFLKRENRRLNEELSDLKMLLSVYEFQESSKGLVFELPPLPSISLEN